jgi:predicted nucleic acid-binding protein
VTFVVLDTDVVSRTHKRTLPASLVRQLVGAAPCITFVTVGELEEWTVVHSWGAARRDALSRWVGGMPRLGYSDEVAQLWGRMAGEAVRRGRPRQSNDMWIAACCIVEGLPLATLNVKDYEDFVDYHGLVLITA